jgi:Glyoxalase-like domain
MALSLDHIFVCTAVGAPESQALLDAGFVEGTRNVHPGQGTSNRRFFFEHGFLELLWVHDAQEATSAVSEPTRLWQRWAHRTTEANPFGICFSSPKTVDHSLPFASWSYEPAYLPKGKRIHFAQGTALSEPELFALSWPQPPVASAKQPRTHKLPLNSMLAVSVGLTDTEGLSAPMLAARDSGLIRVHSAAKPELVIEFSLPKAIDLHLPILGITLRGQPENSA